MSIEKLVDELEDRMYYNGDLKQLDLMEWVAVFSRIMTFVLGLLAIIIVILVPIIVSIEIIYICFPVIREKTEKLLFNVEGKGNKLTVAGFTMRDAIEAVNIGETNYPGSTSLMLWEYLKIKSKAILLVMFLIGFVISGNSIVLFIDSIFRGIFKLIGVGI